MSFDVSFITASSISDPRSGGEEARGPMQPSEAVIAFWGDRVRAGEPQSVIDRGAASAKVFSPPLVRGVAREGQLCATLSKLTCDRYDWYFLARARFGHKKRAATEFAAAREDDYAALDRR